jgi:hypothetical protein
MHAKLNSASPVIVRILDSRMIGIIKYLEKKRFISWMDVYENSSLKLSYEIPIFTSYEKNIQAPM